MIEDQGKCQSCGINDADEEHACPYAQGIDGCDDENYCSCCDECTENCANNI